MYSLIPSDVGPRAREGLVDLVNAECCEGSRPVGLCLRKSPPFDCGILSDKRRSFLPSIDTRACPFTACVRRPPSPHLTLATDLTNIRVALYIHTLRNNENHTRAATARVFRESPRGRSSVAGRGGGRLFADKRHRGGPPHDLHGAYEPAVGVPAAYAVSPPRRLCRGGHAERPGAS